MGAFTAIAAGIGGVASAVIGAKAAKKAGKIQEAANLEAIEEQRAAREESRVRLEGAEENFQPFLESGQDANNILRRLLTTGDTVENFEELSPGFNFRKQQGEEALENAQRQKGLSLSGGAIEEFIDFNQGQASDEFGSFIKRLFGLSEQGRGAAGSIADIAGADAAGISATGVNISNILSGTGKAKADAKLAGANAITSGINTGVNNLIALEQQQGLLEVLGQGT